MIYADVLGARALEAVGLPLKGGYEAIDLGFALEAACNRAAQILQMKKSDYSNDERAKQTARIAALAAKLIEEVDLYHGGTTKQLGEMAPIHTKDALREIEEHYGRISRFARYCADNKGTDLTEFVLELAKMFEKFFGRTPKASRSGPFVNLVAFISDETGLEISADTVKRAVSEGKDCGRI